MVKQALIFRRDLKLSAGKMVVQGAHAAVGAAWSAEADDVGENGNAADLLHRWMRGGCTKLTLSVADEAALLELEQKAIARGLPRALVSDAGRTEVEPGTVTCLAIGPGEIDSIIGSLPLWKEPSGSDTLAGVREFAEQGLNSPTPAHWEAALQDILRLVKKEEEGGRDDGG